MDRPSNGVLGARNLGMAGWRADADRRLWGYGPYEQFIAPNG